MKWIPGYPGYFADLNGAIYSTRGPETLRLVARMHKGYPHVSVKHGVGRVTKVKRAVHQLVCLAFHGDAPSDEHVAGILDGDVANIRPSNLGWMTRGEVVRRQVVRGTAASLRTGEQSNCAKLSDADCAAIRERVGRGETQTAVAAIYGVSQEHTGAIARGVERAPTP